MDISNILRPALDRITSSIASTASYGFTRVLSFTGSFNDRTSLLQDDAELAAGPEQEDEPIPPTRQARGEAAAGSATTVDTFDVEAAAALAPSAGEGHSHSQDAEWRRVAKSVHTVCLFAASASLVLLVNLPIPIRDEVPSKPAGAAVAAEHGPGGALYSADLAFISLGFFSSLGLSMLSIVARPGRETAVAAVQKWGMVAAVASVLVAFTLRMCMMPVA